MDEGGSGGALEAEELHLEEGEGAIEGGCCLQHR